MNKNWNSDFSIYILWKEEIPSRIYGSLFFLSLMLLTSGKMYPVTQRTLTDSPTGYRSLAGDTTELGVTLLEHSIPVRKDDKSSTEQRLHDLLMNAMLRVLFFFLTLPLGP